MRSALLGLLVALAACGGSTAKRNGESCNASSECDTGLVCDLGRDPHICSPTGTVMIDAAVEDGGIDGAPADASPDGATPDGPRPDASPIDAAIDAPPMIDAMIDAMLDAPELDASIDAPDIDAM